ncbi:hypothetical protein M758_1G061000, partial [Ceratodon purpureus]
LLLLPLSRHLSCHLSRHLSCHLSRHLSAACVCLSVYAWSLVHIVQMWGYRGALATSIAHARPEPARLPMKVALVACIDVLEASRGSFGKLCRKFFGDLLPRIRERE